ncbi:LANO_0H22738g1_1 [Lachancea nothofagi CBS 11611]|uniref:Anthranilate phosphoribosyltransferase n=1 Tax=Lachancea nothofagi CBS 11611 TaxID=1266666 RepID=A0A1G4KNR0_9SACH|nr:LANO_0H22738g1_1 [Lachancea nothofagi CBS 11611]
MKDISQYTKLLLQQPPALTPKDLHAAIKLIVESLANDTLNSLEVYVPIASFLTSLRTTGLDLKADYIAEAAKAVLKYSHVVTLDAAQKSSAFTAIDIVGTGGDGQNTFNVSTSSAIVASGIPGIKVCKHGGKASTSNSGAGDLIGVLGCDTSKINSRTVPQLWNQNSFLFLLAPFFHDGMKHVALLRKLLKIPTIFNVLGPLLHPVGSVQKRVLGVYSKSLGLEYARAAAMVYPNSETFVVWGHVGLDEVSPLGRTTVWHTKPAPSSSIASFEVEPVMFGLKEHSLSECASLGPKENAEILTTILDGKYRKGENGIYDYILLNTALLYCLTSGQHNWELGVQKAEESIHSGSARRSLNHFIECTKAL